MGKSAYERWLYFISAPTRRRPETIFPADEAAAIMAMPPYAVDWRKDKRLINKAAKRARAARPRS